MRKKLYKMMFFSFGRFTSGLSCTHNGNESGRVNTIYSQA